MRSLTAWARDAMRHADAYDPDGPSAREAAEESADSVFDCTGLLDPEGHEGPGSRYSKAELADALEAALKERGWQ